MVRVTPVLHQRKALPAWNVTLRHAVEHAELPISQTPGAPRTDPYGRTWRRQVTLNERAEAFP
jgi:hypothetical protein